MLADSTLADPEPPGNAQEDTVGMVIGFLIVWLILGAITNLVLALTARKNHDDHNNYDHKGPRHHNHHDDY